jgi:hypothetical protein
MRTDRWGASSSLDRVVTKKAVPIRGCVNRGPGPASVGDTAGVLISYIGIVA